MKKMKNANQILTAVAVFTIYPGANAANPRIEAISDRGPILEMIVSCPAGTAIVTYSKLEKVYCGAKRGCSKSQSEIIAKSCG